MSPMSSAAPTPRRKTSRPSAQTWVSTAAALALGRLARHTGMTRRAFLEKLILDADQVITRAMSDEAFDQYFTLPPNKR